MKNRQLITWIIGITLLGAFFIYYFYPEPKLPKNVKIDYLLVKKSKRELLAYSDGHLVKIYKVSLGGSPKGAKKVEGDKKTPEGIYFINDKNPNSDYYKNLGISYPSEKDIIEAQKYGKSAGGDVKIHGLRNGTGFIGKFQRCYDWTLGCIAVTDTEIDELYRSVNIGTKIEIKP